MAPRKPTEDDPEQSKRFRQAAAEAAGEQSPTEADKALDDVVAKVLPTVHRPPSSEPR